MSNSKQIVIKDSVDADNFVGLKYKKDHIYLYLPLGYDKETFDITNEITSEQKIELLLLLQSIDMTKKENNEFNKFDNDEGIQKEIPYNSFLWIINEYFNNGLYKNIDKQYTKKMQGKINWKKTLNSEHYFTDNQIVYLNPYYENNIFKSDVITELNNYCLHKSYEYLEFIFGKVNLPLCNLNDEIIQSNYAYYISILNKELLVSFNDKKKMLLNHMKRILSMSYNEDKYNIIDYGTKNYEYVWEKMVNENFGSKIDIKKFFPNAYWTINSKTEKDKSKLRPDSILLDKKNKSIYIIDAKYYKYGVTGNLSDLPHTDSIQKQITYGDHIANNREIYGYEKQNIYNTFVVPFNKNSLPFKTSEEIVYIGYANSAWRNKKEIYNYERISLLLIDTKYMIDCYYKRQRSNIELLMKKIQLSKCNN